MKKLSIGIILILVGIALMCVSRYQIRRICEKYPVEIQLRDFPDCVRYGGPWPQKSPPQP